MSINVDASSRTFGTFLDIDDDVKPWLQWAVLDTSQDGPLQLLTDMACEWVQNYCGRPLAPTTFDRRFDGWSSWNGAYIMLPFYPVLEVVSVTEYWGIAGPHDLDESLPSTQIDGFQVVPNTGRLNRVFPGNVQKPWFPGSRNIEVVWIAGYNPIPPTIKTATLELIAHWVRNTRQQAAFRSPGAVSDYDPSPTSGGLWQGVPNRITALLSPYIRVGMG